MRKLQANPTFVQRNKQRLVAALRQRIGSDKVTQESAKCALVSQPVQNPSNVLGPNMYPQYNGGGGGKGRRHKDILHHQRAGNHFGGRVMTFQSSIAAQRPGDFMGSGPDDPLHKPTPSEGFAHQKPKASVAIRRNGKAPRFITKFGYYGEQEDKTYDGKCEDEYGVQVRTTTEDKLPTHFVWTEKPDFDYGMPQKISSTSRNFIHNDIRRTLEELEGGRIKVHGDARNPQ